MPSLMTGLACGLATALAVAVGAPTYAAAEPGHDHDHDRDVYLSFDRLDDAGLPLLDALGSGEVAGEVSSIAGGSVTAGPDRTSPGHSLRMERFRPDQPASPAVVVLRPVGGAAERTDPGDDDFAFGADFVLDRQSGVSATDNGENLVQRGLAGPDSQYKIQLDGGYPLCRISGSDGAVWVRATERAEPEQWYRARCRRVDDRVTLRVVTFDGSDRREVREYDETGRTGSVSYHGDNFPLAIGGKVDQHGNVLAGDSDQFNGLIDNVVFRRLD